MSKGHATGMAGEFSVMERLFRLNHEAALTLGNAKSIDILTKSPMGNVYQVSVKAIRGGGKWGVGKKEITKEKNVVFVFLLYRDFDDLRTVPEAWVIPAEKVEVMKKPWLDEAYAISGNPVTVYLLANTDSRSRVNRYTVPRNPPQ